MLRSLVDWDRYWRSARCCKLDQRDNTRVAERFKRPPYKWEYTGSSPAPGTIAKRCWKYVQRTDGGLKGVPIETDGKLSKLQGIGTQQRFAMVKAVVEIGSHGNSASVQVD